jgi:hypothetical protein
MAGSARSLSSASCCPSQYASPIQSCWVAQTCRQTRVFSSIFSIWFHATFLLVRFAGASLGRVSCLLFDDDVWHEISQHVGTGQLPYLIYS